MTVRRIVLVIVVTVLAVGALGQSNENLKASIYATHPELTWPNVTQLTKARIIRNWVWRVIGTQTAPPLDFWNKPLWEQFEYMINGTVGGICGEINMSLRNIYRLLGYEAYFLRLGRDLLINGRVTRPGDVEPTPEDIKPGDSVLGSASHGAVLVRIDGKLCVQDAYFYFDIVEAHNASDCIDYLDLLRRLVLDRNRQSVRVEVSMCPTDLSVSSRSIVWIRNGDPLDVVAVAPTIWSSQPDHYRIETRPEGNGTRYFCYSCRTVKRFDEFFSFIDGRRNWYMSLIHAFGFPDDLVYLYAIPCTSDAEELHMIWYHVKEILWPSYVMPPTPPLPSDATSLRVHGVAVSIIVLFLIWLFERQ